MLWYLTGHSRPDLAFAVSQAARFTHSPRRFHEEALERIGQYLKATRTQGLILRPTDSLDMDVYVDSDYCGLWNAEDKHDPSCVKSRTGYVICIANCPIIWISKLQSCISLSSMEAEYNALSQAMRDVLPARDLFKTVGSAVGITEEQLTTFKTTVWEDNNGCLTLARLEPGQNTPRSKHYAVKVHWFRSHLAPNRVVVERIDTSIQRADVMTKALTTVVFQKIWKLLCGW